MKNQKENLRPMTVAEKEKFLKRVKVETEDIPKSSDPKEIFKETISSYQNNMISRVEEIDKVLKTNLYIREAINNLFNLDDDKVNKDILKLDISSRDENIAKLRESKALMTERIKLGEEIIDACINHYEFLKLIDFYFGGVMNLPETEDYKKRIIDEYNK